eukprot:Gb_09381 [translate_table: standard]
MNKPRGSRSSISLETRERDECVEDAINILLQNLDQHIADKFIFPRVVAHGVGRTVAEMVNMVCISHVQRMEGWLVELDGSAPEEWDFPQEPVLPPIDSWARGVVPLRKPETVCAGIEKEEAPPLRPVRRASAMPLSQYKGIPTTMKLSENKGSLRRFTDTSLISVARRVSFQENLTTVIEASRSVARDVTNASTSDNKPPALDSKVSVKKSGTKAGTPGLKKPAAVKDANLRKKEGQDKRQLVKRTFVTGLSKTTPKTQPVKRAV